MSTKCHWQDHFNGNWASERCGNIASRDGAGALYERLAANKEISGSSTLPISSAVSTAGSGVLSSCPLSDSEASPSHLETDLLQQVICAPIVYLFTINFLLTAVLLHS